MWSAFGVDNKTTRVRLDVVLVSLLVAFDGFHALNWCPVVDFKQVLVRGGSRVSPLMQMVKSYFLPMKC